MSVTTQADLLDISRASVYYQPIVNPEDIRAMNAIDEIYTAHPFYGSRRIRIALNQRGFSLCRDHVRRLMHIMCLEAVYPKRRIRTSSPGQEHKVYPYLLKGLTIDHPNHVWGVDITYIRIEGGFVYLVALIDWYSRYVIAWEVSVSLASDFCIATLERALTIAVPDIHNSDQGAQLTDHGYTGILQGRHIQISMDGRGRCFDNIFTERLWRTVKYEDVYLKGYKDISAVRAGLSDYFSFYNNERPHQALNYRTPADVYFQRK